MFLHRLKSWLSNMLHKDRVEQELDEEVRAHVQLLADEKMRAGMENQEALRRARLEVGGLEQVKEQVREIRAGHLLETLYQDVRFGIRMMRKSWGLTLVLTIVLALGIGANTAIYSLMESVLLRSLPVSDPESLVVLNWHSRPPMEANREWVHVVHGVQGILWPGEKGALVSGMFPYAAFEKLRQDNSVFSTLFGYFNGLNRTLSVRGQASVAGVEYVTGEYFHGLAISPAAGRLINSEDDRPGTPPVAVVSFSASQLHFGEPSNAIGQQILVDNIPFTVIGVAPPEFFGVDPSATPDIYLPLHANALIDRDEAARMYRDENFYWIEMMGRLRPGVTLAQAQAVLAPRFQQWVSTTATTDAERAKLPALVLNPGSAGLGSLRRRFSKPLFLLLLMVGMILAITCANIANLLLARASARRREIAVRLSLGAGRFRLVRQLLTETVMLAVLGGAVGVLFAFWGIQVLTFVLSNGQENFTLHAELNWHVLALTAALSVVCGLIFGLAPAIQSTRPDVTPALKRGTESGPRRRAQNVLLIAQIAISFVILVAAGLFVRTLNKLHSVQLGYSRENILLFSVNARQAGHRDPEITTFYANLCERFASIPGVSAASLSQSSIINAGHAGKTYRGTIRAGTQTISGVGVMVAGSHFLTTMQIPIIAGREIDDRDQVNSAPVVVISRQMAKTYFGLENPVGQYIHFPEDNRDLQIIGVSADMRYGSLKDESPVTVFVAASQFPPEGVTYALRTAGDPLSYVKSVREMVQQADARIPVTSVITQAAEIDRTISQEITFAKLCTGFAALALIIACVGLYGTVSYSVTRQVGEIGIRMALGAQRSAVVWMVLRRVLLLAGAGVAISVPVAWVAFRLVKSFLFETQPNDPLTLASAAIILLSAMILAGYLPARRASRIDPLVALRHE